MENNIPSVNRLLENLQLQRQKLEELRERLKYWQTCELEYEELKEEILHSEADVPPLEIVDSWSAEEIRIIKTAEVAEIFGYDKGDPRSSSQVVSLLSRRLDYVQQNVRTVQKQIDTVEKALEKSENEMNPLFNEEEPKLLPLSEIREELDEDGNIISSSVSNPAQQAAGIQAMLDRAGILLADDAGAGTSKKTAAIRDASKDQTESSPVSAGPDSTPADRTVTNSDANAPAIPGGANKSQATGTHLSPSSNGKSEDHKRLQLGTAANSGPGLVKGSFYSGSDVIEVDENDEVIGRTPLVPKNETKEEADLRREMLEYGLNGVGPVVAEMDLEEYSDAEYDDEDYQDGSGSEENEYGMSTNFQITDEYRRQMMELQQRLNATFFDDESGRSTDPMDTAKPAAAKPVSVFESAVQDALPAENGAKETASTVSAIRGTNTKPTSKKGVRFATELDVANESESSRSKPGAATNESRGKRPLPSPLADVVESTRTPSAPAPPSASDSRNAGPKRVSRFKAARTHGPGL